MPSPDLAPFSSLAAADGAHATAYQALVDRSAGCSTHNDRMLRAALAYAQCGWLAFPCAGKIPAIKGGRGCHDATTDPERIAAMWRRYPGSNIGVATGERSGFWVLDVDPQHDGDASLTALEQEHGPLPPTVEQHTGSGGRHLLFRCDAMRPVRNRAGFRSGLDTRGDGGHIVVAPSLHPETGRRYVWVPERHPTRHPIAEAPASLLELVAPSRKPVSSALLSFRTASAPPAANHQAEYARSALRRAAHRVASAPIGQRNSALNAEAYSIGRFVRDGLIAPQTLADTLAAAALAAGEDYRKVVRTLTSALRARGI
jgi:hypothetical protein